MNANKFSSYHEAKKKHQWVMIHKKSNQKMRTNGALPMAHVAFIFLLSIPKWPSQQVTSVLLRVLRHKRNLK